MNETSPPFPNPRPSITAPLAVWILIQLIALLLAAARVQLSAEFGPNAERFAIHEMLAAQIILAGMLFPFLLRDMATTLVIIVTSAPFLLLSAVLSATPIRSVGTLFAYVTVWLLTLSFWRQALPARAHLAAIAVANLLTLGIPILGYLQVEFKNGTGNLWLVALSPLTAALAQIDRANRDSRLWIPLLVLFLAGMIAMTVRKRIARKPKWMEIPHA